jgi:SAM-dependent methyltransferase
MAEAATPWSSLSDHLPHFLEDESDPVIGSWAIGQGTDAPDRKLLRHLLRSLAESRNDGELSLLEVGCGAGIEIKGLIQDGLVPGTVAYTGYDFTPEMIEVCRAKFPMHRFELRDVVTMTDDLVADVVVCRAVLEHLESYERALSNLYRAARTVAVISWFMRPTWNDAEAGMELVNGFVHHRYALRGLLTFVRAECRPALFCRFDFDHHVYPWAVWLLWREPAPAGVLDTLHSYLGSQEFEESVLPVVSHAAEREAETERVIAALSATNLQLESEAVAWQNAAREALTPSVPRAADAFLEAAKRAGSRRLRNLLRRDADSEA